MPNTQSSMWNSQSSMRCDSYIKYPVAQLAHMVSGPKRLHTNHIMDWFFHCNLATYLKTNGKKGKKWSEYIKSGAPWTRIRASGASLAVYVTFNFSRSIIKNTCFKVCLPQSGILHKSITRAVFITMCMNVAKEPIFIYRWYIYFFAFSPIYFLIMFLTWHKKLAKKMNNFCNLVQFWYVIISMMSCYSLIVLKIQHLKSMVPGLRGPAGSPCKSEDITGWGLTHCPPVTHIDLCAGDLGQHQ